MFRAITALILASAAGVATAAATAPSKSSDILLAASPWWEKVTVTIAGDGRTQSCQYQSSLQPNAGKSCDVSSNQASIGKSGSGSKEEYTRITFERRFTPDALPTKGDLQTGDTETVRAEQELKSLSRVKTVRHPYILSLERFDIINGQVMALAIDSRGHVNNCRIVAASGDMRPEYGCDEATAERFDASVGAHRPAAREGYMTILVYGHAEHMV